MSPAESSTPDSIGIRQDAPPQTNGVHVVPGPRPATAEPAPAADQRDQRDDGYERLDPLLAAYARCLPGSAERARLREQLVAGYLPVAHHIARRYANRGEPLQDLVQVASIGLIHAIDRYRPERGDHFMAFAVPTITGEVRRHFRDKTWSMRVPRRLKELHSSVNAAVLELSHQLGRAPRPSEIAASMNLPTEAVLEALEASQSYKAASLDTLLTPRDGVGSSTSALGDRLGAADPGYALFTDSHAVAPYLAGLEPRERRILIMRFSQDMTQTQIAEQIGVSQMHVSRILAATLAALRDAITSDQPTPVPTTAPDRPASWRRMS